MHEWTQYADAFLQALITLEGRGESPANCCSHCQAPEGCYQCLCCDNLGLVCQLCIVAAHQYLPLHRIEVRNPFLSGPFSSLCTVLEQSVLCESFFEITWPSNSAWPSCR
jgi:hypothetical protein